MRLLKQDRIIHCRYAYLYKVPICQINSAFQPKFHCGIAFSFLQINIIIIIICQGFFILKLLFNDNISNLTICEERTTTLQRSLFFSKCSRRLPQWLLPVLIGCLFHKFKIKRSSYYILIIMLTFQNLQSYSTVRAKPYPKKHISRCVDKCKLTVCVARCSKFNLMREKYLIFFAQGLEDFDVIPTIIYQPIHTSRRDRIFYSRIIVLSVHQEI